MTRPVIDPRIKPGFKTQGSWSWNDELLWSKIEVDLDTTKCWNWSGAMSPSGALMGGYKDGIRQMSQARRFVWMSENNESADPYSITLTCKNQYCCNPKHFKLAANNRAKTWSIFGDD